MGDQLAIVAEGLSKYFGPVRALDGVDLEQPAGTVLGMLGPNGAGKTTTVRILATLLAPDGGRPRVAGLDVVERGAAVRRLIGLSGQYAAVDPYLTGRENLQMIGRLYRLGRRAARRGTRRRDRGAGWVVPGHHSHLHQLRPGARGHHARMASGLRQPQPDHRHGRGTASPVPRRAHHQAGQRGTRMDRRAASDHRPPRRHPLPPHLLHLKPSPPSGTGTAQLVLALMISAAHAGGLTGGRDNHRWEKTATMEPAARTDLRAIAAEMDQARQTFHHLLDQATDTGLRRRSNGTRWTNEQLLFHMMFGYLITRPVLVIASIFGRLPRRCQQSMRAAPRRHAWAVSPGQLPRVPRRCAGHPVLAHEGRFDQVIAALERGWKASAAPLCGTGCTFPRRGTRSFTDYMTLADLYRHPTRHFNYHREQLTLTNTD